MYTLEQPAPIPEWQKPGDPRAEDPHSGHPAHVERPPDQGAGRSRLRSERHLSRSPLPLHGRASNSFQYAATRPQQWPPNTVGRYRNTDPVLTNYLVRLAVEKRGEDYLSFPQRALFDKIGVRTMVMETDPYGNFLTQGYELMSGRDWARLGNLYLQDGVWNGERILPEGYAKFVSTRRAGVGGRQASGLRRLLLDQRRRRVPGAEGGVLHVRRRRPDRAHHPVARPRRRAHRPLQGRDAGGEAFRRALALLMEAVPAQK